MLRRCWSLAIVGIFTVAIVPAWGQNAAYNKDAVKALSQRIDEHLAKVWKKAGVTPALAVIMNAVVDALSSHGIEHLDMPATPARVWDALQAAMHRGGAA